MKLKNKSYPKDFRNLIIENLEFKKNQLYTEGLTDENSKVVEINNYIFILTNGLISEYETINLDVYNSVLDQNEISETVTDQVTKILRVFVQLEGYLNTEQSIKNHSNSYKLKFEGFNDYDDEELDEGQVIYAEYLIINQKKFSQYKGKFREGHGNVMKKYIEILNFFQNKEISTESILEFLEK